MRSAARALVIAGLVAVCLTLAFLWPDDAAARAAAARIRLGEGLGSMAGAGTGMGLGAGAGAGMGVEGGGRGKTKNKNRPRPDPLREAGVQVGDRDLVRALQYAGTGERTQRFLRKARSGVGVTVAVVGGSVSKGRGLINATTESGGTLESEENMHWQVYDWVDRAFPSERNVFVNGAQGGVGAGYFSWCFGEHIPLEPDLVLVELGINDVLTLETSGAFERLIRSILELPSRPAIINIEVFTPLFDTLQSSSTLHPDILAYYDVPSLSVRDVLLPHLVADPAALAQWYRTDPRLTLDDAKVREWGGNLVDLMHLSRLGHALAAKLVTSYLDRERLRAGWWRKDIPATPMPPVLLTEPFDPLHLAGTSRPTCRSMNAGGIEHLSPHGSWTEWNWKEKRYLVASEPGARVSFNYIGTRVALAYLRSQTLGLGKVQCWIDNDSDESARVELDGHWDVPVRNMVVATQIAAPAHGPHTLHCELLDKGEFRIVAYMYD